MSTPTNTDEIRRELHRIASGLHDLSAPGATSVTAHIVRNCLYAQRAYGWSGEETYVRMAWELHRAAETYGRACLEGAMSAMPQLMLTPCRHPNTEAINPGLHNGDTLRCADCLATFRR